MPRPRPRSRRRAPTAKVLASALRVMDERVRKCERLLGIDRRPIGFDATAAIGDRIEQDVEDPEVEELP